MKGTISMVDLKKQVDAKNADNLILDVRTPAEYSEGHVPGSRNISHDQVVMHAEELKKYQNVYMHCRSGGRVQMIVPELERLGVNNLVCVVSGGFPQWEAAGFPVEK